MRVATWECPVCQASGVFRPYDPATAPKYCGECAADNGRDVRIKVTRREFDPGRSSPEPSTSTWRDIKTAPKDGTRVIIGWGSEFRAAWWDVQFDYKLCYGIDDDDDDDYAGHDYEQPDVCSGCERCKDGLIYIGAWTDAAVLSFGYEETHSYKPTHWMPAPEPTP